MRGRWVRWLCVACLITGVEATTHSASAQDAAELQQARDKFQRALALQTGGDWAGAVALLKEVAAVRSTPQVRFNIALCEENLGQLVAAVGDYELAAADARQTDETEVVEQAQRRIDELRGRIPKIIVTRGANADTASITLDGVTLGDRVLGKPMNVDPGPHVITARATGFESFRVNVRVGESETKTVKVELHASELPPPPPPIVPPKPATAAPSHTAAYVIGGIGVLALGSAGAMYALRQSTINKLDRECNPKCPLSLKDTKDRGETYTLLGNIGLGVGVAGVGIGAILLLSGGSEPATGFRPGAADSLAGLS